MTEKLSKDEISLYGRQIRLWGFEGQARLREARVAVLRLSGAGVEIVKNLALGGIGHISIFDSSELLEQDLNVNFFVDASQVGEKKGAATRGRISELNPRTEINVSEDSWKEWNGSEWSRYDVVIGCALSGEEISFVNSRCRDSNVKFIACGVHGLYGYIFNDLIETKNWISVEKSGRRVVGDKIDAVSEIVAIEDVKDKDSLQEKIQIQSKYKPFTEINFEIVDRMYPSIKKKTKKVSRKLFWMIGLLGMDSKYGIPIEEVDIDKEEILNKVNEVVNKFSVSECFKFDSDEMEVLRKHAFCEYAPTNAIIGGVVSQDVVNCIVQQELCVTNFAVLDGESIEMPVYIL